MPTATSSLSNEQATSQSFGTTVAVPTAKALERFAWGVAWFLVLLKLLLIIGFTARPTTQDLWISSLGAGR